MKNLYYSEVDGILFWVSGYDFAESNSNVVAIINDLQAKANQFAFMANVDIAIVKTAYIHKSRRYLYMRVFYCDLPLDTVPKEAFVFVKYTEENRKEIIPHLSGYNLDVLQNTMWRLLND